MTRQAELLRSICAADGNCDRARALALVAAPKRKNSPVTPPRFASGGFVPSLHDPFLRGTVSRRQRRDCRKFIINVEPLDAQDMKEWLSKAGELFIDAIVKALREMGRLEEKS